MRKETIEEKHLRQELSVFFADGQTGGYMEKCTRLLVYVRILEVMIRQKLFNVDLCIILQGVDYFSMVTDMGNITDILQR